MDYLLLEKGHGPPNQLHIKGKLESKASVIASEMNHFLIDKVKSIREKIDFLPNSLNNCHQKMSGKHCKLWLNHLAVGKVTKLIKSLKNSKCASLAGFYLGHIKQ